MTIENQIELLSYRFLNDFFKSTRSIDTEGNIKFIHGAEDNIIIGPKFKFYTKDEMIDFGQKMQIIRDVDCDGNVDFMFDPETYFETNGVDGLKKSD